MKILGVTVSDSLSAASHITDVLESSSRSLSAVLVGYYDRTGCQQLRNI